jgi:hypothetical protein
MRRSGEANFLTESWLRPLNERRILLRALHQQCRKVFRRIAWFLSRRLSTRAAVAPKNAGPSLDPFS